MKKTKWLLLSILLFLALSPSLALAAGTGGGGGALPWETPLQNVQQSLTGPVAKGIALVAIVGALGTLVIPPRRNESVHESDRVHRYGHRHVGRR